MERLSLRLSLAVLVSFIVLPETWAAAEGIDPGDFRVTIEETKGGGSKRDDSSEVCTANGQATDLRRFYDEVISRWYQHGNPPVVTCTMSMPAHKTNVEQTGTVENKTVGSGDMAQTCDVDLDISVTYDVTSQMTPAGNGTATVSAGNFRTSVKGFEACTWSMTFKDGDSSRLSGSIEQVISASGSGETVHCPPEYINAEVLKAYCIPINMSAKVYVVGGTGFFAGAGGTGSFADRWEMPIIIPSGRNVTSQSAFVRAATIGVGSVRPAANTEDSASSMKVALLRGAKASVRLVSPVKIGNKRTLGTGSDGKSAVKVKLVSVPGSACGMKASSGSKSATVVKAKKDSDGVLTTKVTSQSLRKSLKVAYGAKVSLKVSCGVGGKTVTSNQTVTLDE